MSKCYNKPYLNKVIARIDFTANNHVTQKPLPKNISDSILKLFPIPEPREIISKQVQLTNQGTKETQNKENHLFFHGVDRGKTLCLAPNFLYLEITKYDTYDVLKEEFELILDKLFDLEEFSARRFGLRYINNILLDEKTPLDWSTYLDDSLLAMFDIPEDSNLLSRAFANIVQQFEDSMLLNFQYGMHNPDFPSKIKQKLFILDFDAYYQGVISKEEIKSYIDTSHERIESLYEKSIKEALRKKMEEV